MNQLSPKASPKPPIGALLVLTLGGILLAFGLLGQFVPEVAAIIHPQLAAGRVPLGLIMTGLGFEAMGLKGVLAAATRNRTVLAPKD